MNGTEVMGPGRKSSLADESAPQKSTQENLIAEKSEHEKSTMGNLLMDLLKDALGLVREELELATNEIVVKVSNTWKNSKYFTIGALVTYAGFLFMLGAAVVALSEVIPMSLSAFAVGLIVMAAGLIVMRTCR
jgi:hypothetical protein